MLFLAFSLLCACGGGGGSNGTASPATTTRSFSMGFTPIPYDVDPPGLPAEFSGDAEFTTWLVTPGYDA
jgi:hypothetical protein